MTTHPHPTPETASHSPFAYPDYATQENYLIRNTAIGAITAGRLDSIQRAEEVAQMLNDHPKLTAQNRRLVDALKEINAIAWDDTLDKPGAALRQIARKTDTLLTEIKEGGE